MPLTIPLTPEEELYWLALRLVPGLGTRRSATLLERFRTPQAIFRASHSELEAAGLPGALALIGAQVDAASEEAAFTQQQLIKQMRAAN